MFFVLFLFVKTESLLADRFLFGIQATAYSYANVTPLDPFKPYLERTKKNMLYNVKNQKMKKKQRQEIL
jgi:hypothetical protein